MSIVLGLSIDLWPFSTFPGLGGPFRGDPPRFDRGVSRHIRLRFPARKRTANIFEFPGGWNVLSRGPAIGGFRPLVLDSGRLRHGHLGLGRFWLDLLRTFPSQRATGRLADPLSLRHAWHVLRHGHFPEPG